MSVIRGLKCRIHYSKAVRAALSSSRCANKTIMNWIRELFWVLCQFNFDISSVYLRSQDNIICDALSRWQDPCSKLRINSTDRIGWLCCSFLFA